MSSFAANYRVTLRSVLPARESAFVSALLEVKVFREPEDWLLPLYIPHELVLLVSGSADPFPARFGS
jgi:hypothetical protein